MKASWLIILFALGATTVETSKILVLPFGMASHINIYTILGKALKDGNHEVWVLSFDKFAENIRKRGLIPLTFPLKEEDDIFTGLDNIVSKDAGNIETVLADPWWGMAFSRHCHAVMQNERITKTIQETKFDLVLVDGVDNIACNLMIPYRFDIPFVTFHAFHLTSWAYGVTGMPSIEPEVAKGMSNRMDFWQRLDNLHSWLSNYDNAYYDMYADHMDKYCPSNKPKIPLKKLASMAEMFFVNHFTICLDYPRVSAPNLQYIGGVTALPGKPLPKDLDDYISGAEHGVIVSTFGTVNEAHYTWKRIGQKFFDAFARLPQRIIVQYKLDKIYGTVPENVKLVKWLPQNDVLAHKNVKLFISHGGNNGHNEAAYHGVPVLTIPAFTEDYIDQVYCGRRIEVHAFGKMLVDKYAISSEELYQTVTEILTNKTYAQNIKKCSEMIRSMPKPLDQFVFWVNHVLRFGGAHLRPPSLDMPLYQVLMLDIVAYYVIYYLVIIHAGVFILYFLLKYIWGRLPPKIKAE